MGSRSIRQFHHMFAIELVAKLVAHVPMIEHRVIAFIEELLSLCDIIAELDNPITQI